MTKCSCFRMFAVSDFYLVQAFLASPFFEPSALFRLLLCLGYPSCCECSQVKTILPNSFVYVSWNFTSFMESDMCLSSTVLLFFPPTKGSLLFLLNQNGTGWQRPSSKLAFPACILHSICENSGKKCSSFHMHGQSAWIFMKLSPRKNTEMKLLTFELHFFQGTIDDISFFKMSNNHMVDDVNTILCVVTG